MSGSGQYNGNIISTSSLLHIVENLLCEFMSPPDTVCGPGMTFLSEKIHSE